MLLVVLPLAVVFSTVKVQMYSLAVSLVVEPVTLVDVAFRMDQSASAVHDVVLPPAFVHRSIRPNFLAHAFSDISSLDPLAFIEGVTLEKLNFSGFEVGAESNRDELHVVKLTHLILRLLNASVLVGDAFAIVSCAFLVTSLRKLAHSCSFAYVVGFDVTSKFLARKHAADSCLDLD